VNDSPFPVQRSLLSAAALTERVLANYDLPGSPACHFWRRSINDLYLVKAEGARFVLRVSPANWRSHQHLVVEIDLLNYLHRNQLSVPRPIRCRDGAHVQTLNAPEGPRHAILFTFVPGAAQRATETNSQRYGQAIARFHTVTDGYPAGATGFRFEPADMVNESLAHLQPLFGGHRSDYEYLLEIATGLKGAADKLPRGAPAYGLCHGDVNDGNFLLGDGDQWALLDFEYFGYGWRVLDIATFLNNQLYQLGGRQGAQAILEAFLEGYQSVRPLGQAELEAIPSFVVLRQLWLLGRGARFQPNIGLSMFEEWVFDRCLPLIREWVADPWRSSG
jgi:Ser/Thr protein kinase RdoA (MazF antagonist)